MPSAAREAPSAPSEARVQGYRRRDPQTVLYRVLHEHAEPLLAELDSLGQSGLPSFVKRELRAFLQCGILAHGFARVHCGFCGRDTLVAFSCKGRGFCPSCGGRRMTATAAHLVDHVFPEAPVRQWVLSLPYALRLPCAFDHELMASVRSIFIRAVFSNSARRAKALGLPPDKLGFRTGAVNIIQRAGGALNLNPHLHALFIDGVYTRACPLSPARFHELPPPEPSDVEWVLRRVHSRLTRLFEQRAEQALASGDAERASELLAHLAASSIRGQVATGNSSGTSLPALFQTEPPASGSSSPAAPGQLVASGAGFCLHAGVHVPANRRGRLEELCRYIARPPLATDRLTIDDQGRILYSLRHPYGGKTHAIFTPRTLLERLCALAPFPRRHLLTYHGVLAPASTWRSDVVPVPPRRKPSPPGDPAPPNTRTYRWADLMKRAFEIDVLTCQCGSPRELIACITDRPTIRRILRHLGLPDQPPSSPPPRPPPRLDFSRPSTAY